MERWLNSFPAAGRASERFQGEGAVGPWYGLQVTGTYYKSIGPPMAGKKRARS